MFFHQIYFFTVLIQLEYRDLMKIQQTQRIAGVNHLPYDKIYSQKSVTCYTPHITQVLFGYDFETTYFLKRANFYHTRRLKIFCGSCAIAAMKASCLLWIYFPRDLVTIWWSHLFSLPIDEWANISSLWRFQSTRIGRLSAIFVEWGHHIDSEWWDFSAW